MFELKESQIELVNGGISSGEQITLQSGLIAAGVTLAAAGFALTPLGAALFIGTSLAGTASYVSRSMGGGSRNTASRLERLR